MGKKIPHFTTITVHANEPRKATRHGKIEKVFDDIFIVRGKMKPAPGRSLFEKIFVYYSRTMTVVRAYNDKGEPELSLFNTIRLNERTLRQLAKLGRVKNVVRLGSYHGVDDAYYLNRYNAQYWTVAGMINAEGLDVKVNTLSNEEGGLPVHGSKLFSFENIPYPEAIYILPLMNDGRGIAITTDSIQNHRSILDIDNSPLVSFRIWLIGLAGEARLGPIWLLQQTPANNNVEDKTASMRLVSEHFRPQFERLLKTCAFDALIPGHGWPIFKDAKAAIRKSLDDQLPPS